MKHLFLGMVALSLFTLTACNSGSDADRAYTENTEQTTETAGAQANFSELFGHYHHLTTALSSDNAAEAGNAANGLLDALSKVEKDNLPADRQGDYDNLAADIEAHAKGVSDNTANIAAQREHLVSISKDFYEIAKNFGTNKPVYKIYCSMYDNDRGAYWLSDTKEVKNPYFGSDMFSCGDVQETLN